MAKVALLGFPQGIESNASRIASVLKSSFPETLDIFTDIRSASAFVISKDPSSGKLTGHSNHIFIFDGHDVAQIEMAQTRLPVTGVSIHILTDFEDGRDEADIRIWLATGTFPLPPEPMIPSEQDLLDDLFGDGPSIPDSVSPTAAAAAFPPVGFQNHVNQVRPPNVSGPVSYEPEADELANSAQADDDIPLPGSYAPESTTPDRSVFSDPNTYVPESTNTERGQFAAPAYDRSEFSSPVEDAPLPSQFSQVGIASDEDAPLPTRASFMAPTQDLYEARHPVQPNVPAPVVADSAPHALEVTAPEQGLVFDQIIESGNMESASSVQGSFPAPPTTSTAPLAPVEVIPVLAPVQEAPAPLAPVQEIPVIQYAAPEPVQYDTPVMTPDGEVGMGDLRVGDKVFGSDGNVAPVVPSPELVPLLFPNAPSASAPAPNFFAQQPAQQTQGDDVYRQHRYDSAPYRETNSDPQSPSHPHFAQTVAEPVEFIAPVEPVYVPEPERPPYVQGQYDNSRSSYVPGGQYNEPYVAPDNGFGRATFSDEIAGLDIAPEDVRQASPGVVKASFIPAPERAVEMPVQRQRVIVEEEPVALTAVEYLEPVAQQSQGILEEELSKFAQTPANNALLPGQGGGEIIYVTGSHGGAGKTTVSYMLANVLSRALAQEEGDSKEVWLIEADYRNSKLAERLTVDSGNDSGYMANFLMDLSKRQSNTIPNLPAIRAGVIEKTVIKLPSGLNVVTCPYDSTKRDTRFIQIAIQQIVEYAANRGAYVFIDADTLSSDDVLDRKLATIANKIIMVSDAGHISDVQRAANTMVKPVAQGGIGVPISKINVFLNKTGAQRFQEVVAKGDLNPLSVNGFIPSIEEWDTTWVGDQERGPNFVNAVAKFAVFLNTVVSIPALKKWESHKLITAKQGSGFKLFRRKPKV